GSGVWNPCCLSGTPTSQPRRPCDRPLRLAGRTLRPRSPPRHRPTVDGQCARGGPRPGRPLALLDRLQPGLDRCAREQQDAGRLARPTVESCPALLLLVAGQAHAQRLGCGTLAEPHACAPAGDCGLGLRVHSMISKPYASMNLHVRLRSENVSASRSINVHLMPSSNAAIPVVPLPANGSQTLLTSKLPRMSVNASAFFA